MTVGGGAAMGVKELCMALMEADTEDQVVEILRDAGYWDDADAWRYIGDSDTNWSTIGNQQSGAVAALAEKFVNSIDSRLTNACLESGVDPKGPDAPEAIREAVAMFFENAPNPKADHVGRVSSWLDAQIRLEARNLTLAATGPKGRTPSLSIADVGEGQSPDQFPETFMSLNKRNKVDIPFVQGKFNMGGTGALYFCGTRKLQLIVSRRNPLLFDGSSPREAEWGFTVTRREHTGGRTSVCTYLAPINAAKEPRRGSVLSFEADTMPILPEASKEVRQAYQRHVDHGTLIKLYEYEDTSKSNIVFTRKGLRQKIETHLPELALPIGVFECRPYMKGTEGGSFFTPARGTVTRLDQEKNEDLEMPPIGAVMQLDGNDIFVKVYAFKRRPRDEEGKKKRGGFLEEYAQGAGVIYVVNGQTHHMTPKEFFGRKAVGLDYLKEDLLVAIDCSAVDEITREDLFMNSRDRNRFTPLWKQLEDMVARFLNKDETLQDLAIRRREEAVRDRVEDNQALADLLDRVLRAAPDLAKILLGGIRLPSPFPKPGSGRKQKGKKFKGLKFPTYFHFDKHKPGEEHKRRAELGRDLRVTFVTDAKDNYFWRTGDRGCMRVLLHRVDGGTDELSNGTVTLRGGIARWAGSLPSDAQVGDVLSIEFEVTDPLRDAPFRNRLTLEVIPRVEHPTGNGTGKKRERGNDKKGENDDDGGLGLPEVMPVVRDDWEEFNFDERSALAVQGKPSGGYDFYYNQDNDSLLRAQKADPSDADLTRERFRCSLVLIGLALIQQFESKSGGENPDVDVATVVSTTTTALAPVILPLVEFVGTLSVASEE